jgi:hypothetical protein
MPLVERRVSFRGTSLYQIVDGAPRIICWVTYGLDSGPRVRGVDTIIPSATGRIARNRVADGRTIGLDGFVMGAGADLVMQRDDFRDAIEQLRALFDPTLAPGTLSVILEGGTVAEIDARTMPEEPEWGPIRMPTYREFSVDLEAVDDEWSLTGS